MNFEIFLYLISTIIVLWGMDSLNINGIFRKNRELQAKVIYIIIALALIYLLKSFMYDFINLTKII